jgi:hypothetical protein
MNLPRGRGCPAARARQICRVGAEQVYYLLFLLFSSFNNLIVGQTNNLSATEE